MIKQAFQNSILNIQITDRIDAGQILRRDPEIVYVMEGILEVFKEEAEWILHENDFLVINSGEEHSYTVQEPGLFCVMRLNYTEVADYLRLRSHDIICHSMRDGVGTQGKAGRLLQGIIGYYLSEDKADEARMYAEIYELLHQLREFCLVRKEKTTGSAAEDSEERLRTIRLFIRENYNRKISLSELASETYLSTTYLSRYIRERFGKTFSEVLTDVRLEHAEKDIVETDRSITQISMDNGFPLPASFNKAFRQRYGVSPSAWRRQQTTKTEEKKTGSSSENSGESLDAKIRSFAYRHQMQLRASGNNTAELSANVSEAKLFQRFWEGMINGGAARDLMRADMQEHLLQLRDGLHFTHVRIWDLYAPELMLTRGDDGRRMNFSRMDVVFDFLCRHQLHPYVELGAKPVILLRNIDDYLIYEERRPLFSNPEEYGHFLNQFMQHYINRYGIEEVEQWYFEQWMDTRTEDVKKYLQIFDTVYTHIKAFSPKIRIGGPGFSEESRIRMPELLRSWKNHVSQPDFISVYSYPYLPPEEHAAQYPETSERIQESNYVRRLIDENRQLLWDNGFWKQELHLSEWNFTVSNRNLINDSIFKGAYIIKNLLNMIGKADVAGYWFGTDLFSEFYDAEHILDGSGGLITKDRICKPAYYGMYFFSRLDRYLLYYNEDGIITTNGRGNFAIVCHNYKHPSYRYYRETEGSMEAQRYAEYFDEDTKQFRFVIRGVSNGVYQIKTRMVDRENGSVLDEWERMGFTDELTANDIEYLQKVCVPRIKMETVTVDNGILEISSLLTANAIAFIHIYHLIR